jgi:hypothetical protein
MKPELGPMPDEIAKAKLEELRKAEDGMRAFFAVKEAPACGGPELTRAERRRQARNSKKLLKVRP